jgi:UDP-N-acetylglucosamine transferase subunit ALG13
MIFVTVGNDFRNFDRLLKKMDEIAPCLPGKVVIQRGYSRYSPRNTDCFDFIPMDRAVESIRRSELVVSHAGIGTIIHCKEYQIPLFILPRRKAFAEHMNDHQLEIAHVLEEMRDENIYVVYHEDELKEAICRILKEGKKRTPKGDAGKTNLLRTIRDFVQAIR